MLRLIAEKPPHLDEPPIATIDCDKRNVVYIGAVLIYECRQCQRQAGMVASRVMLLIRVPVSLEAPCHSLRTSHKMQTNPNIIDENNLTTIGQTIFKDNGKRGLRQQGSKLYM